MNVSDPLHNQLMELAKSNKCKRSIKNKIRKILNKYQIDINYDGDLILCLMVSMVNFCGISACLELGANPNEPINESRLFLNNQTISPSDQLRIDGIFKSFQFNCSCVDNWNNVLKLDGVDIDNWFNSDPGLLKLDNDNDDDNDPGLYNGNDNGKGIRWRW